MSEFFTVSVLIATFASGVRLATPYLLAALGETLGQRSGVLTLELTGDVVELLLRLLDCSGVRFTVTRSNYWDSRRTYYGSYLCCRNAYL